LNVENHLGKVTETEKQQGANVIHQNTFSTRTGVIVGGFALLTLSSSFAQTPQTETPPKAAFTRVVPLISGTCPTVHNGEAISLDWNPGFDPSWAVSGLVTFKLTFGLQSADGVNTRVRSGISMGGRDVALNISANGNGYFHIEVPIPRRTSPGVYQLIDAEATPQTVPNYQGDRPKMTVTPVREHFCITVLSPSLSQ
jgi:hypothetical protein